MPQNPCKPKAKPSSKLGDWCFIGIMENKMDTMGINRGYRVNIGVILGLN